MLTHQIQDRGLREKLAAGTIVFILAIAVGPANAQTRAERAETTQIAVAAEKTFGLQLLRAMVVNKPGSNVFISPLSIFLALQMAGDGAAGATRAVIWKTLALPVRDAAVLDASSSEMQRLLVSNGQVELNIANALWSDQRFTMAPDFANLCESVFAAHAASLNFADPGAAREINDWVSSNTNGKITSIVTPDSVAKSAMILTNAVYFAGSWRGRFPIAATQPASFHKRGGLATVSMMHAERISGAYRSGASFEGAMLDYGRSGMFLYALLPRPGKTPQEVLAALDPAHLPMGHAGIDLDLKLPRFTLDFSTPLGSYLKKMGMGLAFHVPGADFSVMGSKGFFISEVLHKTRLEVDENGTVAAAATSAAAAGGARGEPKLPPIRILVFNRPFVVLIGDSLTGALLFAGVVENP